MNEYTCYYCGGTGTDPDNFIFNDGLCRHAHSCKTPQLEKGLHRILTRLDKLEAAIETKADKPTPPQPEPPDVAGLAGNSLWSIAGDEVGFAPILMQDKPWENLGRLEQIMRDMWKCYRYNGGGEYACGWGSGKLSNTANKATTSATPDDYARAAIKLVRRIKAGEGK